jgi:hypothetical protein
MMAAAGPDRGDCRGDMEKCRRHDCPIFGSLLKPNKDGSRRVRGCGDKVATGTRARRKGKKAQRDVANRLGVPVGVEGGDEETWRYPLRVEVKQGKQVQAAVTAYRRTREQSDRNSADDDERPFMCVAVHDGLEVCVVALDDLDVVAETIVRYEK